MADSSTPKYLNIQIKLITAPAMSAAAKLKRSLETIFTFDIKAPNLNLTGITQQLGDVGKSIEKIQQTAGKGVKVATNAGASTGKQIALFDGGPSVGSKARAEDYLNKLKSSQARESADVDRIIAPMKQAQAYAKSLKAESEATDAAIIKGGIAAIKQIEEGAKKLAKIKEEESRKLKAIKDKIIKDDEAFLKKLESAVEKNITLSIKQRQAQESAVVNKTHGAALKINEQLTSISKVTGLSPQFISNLSLADKDLKRLSGSLEKLHIAFKMLGQEKFAKLAKDINSGTTMKKTSSEAANMANAMRYIKELDVLYPGLTEKLNLYGGALQKQHTKAEGFLASVKNYAHFQMEWFSSMGVIFAITGAITSAIRATAQFDQTMKDFQAVTGLTNIEMKGISDAVIRVSQETPLAASEVAKLGLQLSRAGLNAEEAAVAMGVAAKVAVVSGEETKLVADTMATAIMAWGLGVEGAEKVGNTLAIAMNKSRLTVQDIGTSFNYIAGVAKSLNMSLEETTSVLAVLSNVGVKASTMATGMTQFLSELIAPSKRLREYLESVGADISKLDPTLIQGPNKMATIMKELRNIGFSTSEAFGLMQVRAARFFMFLGTAGPEALQKMSDNMANPQQLNDAFAISMEGVLNKLKQLWNTFTTSIIGMGEGVFPALKAFVDGLTILAQAMYHVIHPFTIVLAKIQEFDVLGKMVSVLAAVTAGFWLLKIAMKALNYELTLTKLLSKQMLWGYAIMGASLLIDKFIIKGKDRISELQGMQKEQDETNKKMAIMGEGGEEAGDQMSQGFIRAKNAMDALQDTMSKWQIPQSALIGSAETNTAIEGMRDVYLQIHAETKALNEKMKADIKAVDDELAEYHKTAAQKFIDAWQDAYKNVSDATSKFFEKFEAPVAKEIRVLKLQIPKTKDLEQLVGVESLLSKAYESIGIKHIPHWVQEVIDKKREELIFTEKQIKAEQKKQQIIADANKKTTAKHTSDAFLSQFDTNKDNVAKRIELAMSSGYKVTAGEQLKALKQNAIDEIAGMEKLLSWKMAEITELPEGQEKNKKQAEIESAKSDIKNYTKYAIQQLLDFQEKIGKDPLKRYLDFMNKDLATAKQKLQQQEEERKHASDMAKADADIMYNREKASLDMRAMLNDEFYQRGLKSAQQYYDDKMKIMQESLLSEQEVLDDKYQADQIRVIAQMQDSLNMLSKQKSNLDALSGKFKEKDRSGFTLSGYLDVQNGQDIDAAEKATEKLTEAQRIIATEAATILKEIESTNKALSKQQNEAELIVKINEKDRAVLEQKYKLEVERFKLQQAIVIATESHKREIEKLELQKEINELLIKEKEFSGDTVGVEKLKLTLLTLEHNRLIENLKLRKAAIDAEIKQAGKGTDTTYLQSKVDLLNQVITAQEAANKEELKNAQLRLENPLIGGLRDAAIAAKDLHQSLAEIGKLTFDNLKNSLSEYLNELIDGTQKAQIEQEIEGLERERSQSQGSVDYYKHDITGLQQQLDELNARYQSGAVDAATYMQISGELRGQMADSQAQWNEAKKAVSDYNSQIEDAKNKSKDFMDYITDFAASIRKAMIDLLAEIAVKKMLTGFTDMFMNDINNETPEKIASRATALGVETAALWTKTTAIEAQTAAYWALAAAMAASNQGGLAGLFSGSAGGAASPAVGGATEAIYVAHDGGRIPEYHGGGLSRDERHAVLLKRERVLDPEQNLIFEDLVSILGELKSGRTRRDNEETQGAGVTQININAVDAKSFKELCERNPGAILGVTATDFRQNGPTRRMR